jgi:hypothetical protein
MFFEDDEKDIENSWDDVNLDDNDDEDAVTWDELLGEEGSDLMSVKPNGKKEEHAQNEDEDIIDLDNADDFSSLMEEENAQEPEPTGSISDKEKELINLDSDEGYIDGEVYTDASSDDEDKNFVDFEDEEETPQQKTQDTEEDLFFEEVSEEKNSQSMPSPEISLSEENTEDLYEQNFEESASSISPIGVAPKASKETGGSKTPVVLGLIVAVFLVCIAGIVIYIFKNSGGVDTAKDFNPQNLEQNLEEKQPQDMMQAGGNPEDMQPGENPMGNSAPFHQGQKPEEKEKIVMDVINTGRANPFIPAGNFTPAGYTVPTPVDVLAPPEVLSEENKIATITVSGILFDSLKPSAIINVGDVDHFVQKGDTIDEYVVTDITRTAVVIRSGKNIYRAAVGQEFNTKPQHIDGQTNYVYNKNSKTVSRQYFSPTDVVVNVKDDNQSQNQGQGQGQGQGQSQNQNN